MGVGRYSGRKERPTWGPIVRRYNRVTGGEGCAGTIALSGAASVVRAVPCVLCESSQAGPAEQGRLRQLGPCAPARPACRPKAGVAHAAPGPARATTRPPAWNPQELLARGLVGALRRTAARAPPGFWAHAGRPPLASAAFPHWRALLWRPAHPPACGRRAGPRARKPRARVHSWGPVR